MKQHVISEWLLRAFARGRPLWQYDKLSREISAVETDDFLVEVDAHSVEIEQAFHAIEVRASRAAQTLAKPVRHYPPGLYAVVAERATAVVSDPDLVEGAVAEGVRLFVSQRVIPSPPRAQRLEGP